jgi:hypothetical protein
MMVPLRINYVASRPINEKSSTELSNGFAMDDMQTSLTYRAFIDEMVSSARQSVSASRLATNGHTERTNDAALPLDPKELAQRDFCKRLTAGQKDIMTRLLTAERQAAVHDVLAYLEWAVSTERLQVVGAGGSFANDIEETMHGDFISRLAGHEWQAAAVV